MMDFAERGAVEKTFDELLESESENLGSSDGAELVDGEDGLTPAGRLYTAGVLTGILATIRTFSNESTALTADDVTEIDQIVTRREREVIEQLIEAEQTADS